MKSKSSAKGFTLLEVMVTLFLLSILLSLVMPHLGMGKLEAMRSSANRFHNVLIWLRDQSSFGMAEYRLRLDLPKNIYYCEILQEQSYLPVDDPLLQPDGMKPGTSQMIWQPDKGDLPDLSEINVRFTPFGPNKAILVQFANQEQTDGFTVSYRPEWSKPRLEQGLLKWE